MLANPSKKAIGVLALQGAFSLHKPHIEHLGATYVEVVNADDLDKCDALILPGGESSTMIRLLEYKNMWDKLDTFLSHNPSWGICAGAILLADSIDSHSQRSFRKLPITISRNGYGRQLDSHEGHLEDYKVSWIRAPKIQDVSSEVEVIDSNNGQIVGVKKAHTMATTFHPELNQKAPSPWHHRFHEIVTALN